jgi:hypothetical protein
VLTALIAEDGRVAPAPYHKPALAVLDLRLADGDLGTGITVQLRPFGRLSLAYGFSSFRSADVIADWASC